MDGVDFIGRESVEDFHTRMMHEVAAISAEVQAGIDAFGDHQKRTDNPLIGVTKREAWRKGWDYAHAVWAAKLPDGIPCKHPGCLNHISHPCEGCGRIGGRRA